MLGVPDAYELPRSPGHGYLKFGTEPLVRFKAAYVSGPYRRPGSAGAGGGRAAGAAGAVDYTTHYVPAPDAGRAGRSRDADGDAGRREPARRAGRPAGRPGPAGAPGVAAAAGRAAGARRAARPGRRRPGARPHRRQPGAARRAAGAGRARRQAARAAPRPAVAATWPARPGTSPSSAARRAASRTALRTLICGAGAHPHPGRGAGLLPRLRRRRARPRCATCRTSAGWPAGWTPSAVRRTVGEVAHAARRAGAAVRRARHRLDGRRTGGAGRDGRFADDPFGDVFLVVDGWATLRKEFEDLEPVITDIATRGLSYGIHVVAAATRWMDFRPAIRDLFGSRLELRLGDPSDSMVNRRAAINVPEQPGRGLVEHPTDKNKSLHLLTVRPRARAPGRRHGRAGQGDRRRLAGPAAPRGAAAAGRRCRTPTWTSTAATGLRAADRHRRGRPAAGARRLRHRAALPALRRRRVRQVVVPARAGHARSPRRFTPEQARIILVDYRRSLLGAVTSRAPASGTARRPRSTAELIESVAGVHAAPAARPGRHARAAARPRPGGPGPELFVLVDDYDLVATGPANPLHAAAGVPAAGPRHRPAPGPHPPRRRRRPGAVRAGHPAAPRAVLARPGDVRATATRARCSATSGPAPLPPGRGWLVTRREGVRLVQLAHLPPS